ncbi:ATP-binding cassette domain-containing protein [Saccharicrinis aurantiacus]|uniref:ATP-binding cassette domain-containing protein n=1 Tax=Saccharicrinis aurantiacus TaxID=1849719 RepID=UPI0008391BDD|nr:ATP-binding cassette domain-containing protein [Saccharicrinis aurantiacus]
MKHYAIESESISVKGDWVKHILSPQKEKDLPELDNKRGLLFSNVTLEKMIDDEMRLDNFALSLDKSRSIRTYSSGEQKKALLIYLINQKPEFLILDNPFDCLDVASVASLKESILELSKVVPIIQLFKREHDILPFITDVLVLEKEKLVKRHSLNSFKESLIHQNKDVFVNALPAAAGKLIEVSQVLVELKNVTVSYDERCIIKKLNWKIQKGEFWHLIGPNGSGKTTLLTMIYGDNPKAYGVDLFLFGHKKGTGESVWEIKEKIGYFTPSMTELFSGNHTAENMIISGLVDSVGLYRRPTDIQQRLAMQWLSLLGLKDKAQTLFYKLSQIEQRMILIARAMVKYPPLLILDEPSTGLDDKHANMMVSLINKIANESDSAILYVSHRTELGLKPDKKYVLTPSAEGSIGEVL